MAVHNDALWPPQCCKAVTPIEDIEHLPHEDMIHLVKAKQVEMSIPILKRVYCVNCSTFIPQKQIDETKATCHECSSSTCTECKEEVHIGGCQNKFEQDIKDLEALAEEEGWKKCSNCLMFVQNILSCNHIT
jgi:RNase P subunit RPR2